MGKAIPKKIKTMAEEINELLGDKITNSFEKNKETVRNLDLGNYKKNNNLIAAYLTRIKAKKD